MAAFDWRDGAAVSLVLCWCCVLGLIAAAAGGAATAAGQSSGSATGIAAGTAIACCLCSVLIGLVGHANDEAARKKSAATAS